jgi:heme/copper-type cytochrome/quinol oxidase subunit 2
MLGTTLHLLAQLPSTTEQAHGGKTAAEEGRDVVLSMLVVGLVFVGVAVIGDLWHWRSRKRHARRANRSY